MTFVIRIVKEVDARKARRGYVYHTDCDKFIFDIILHVETSCSFFNSISNNSSFLVFLGRIPTWNIHLLTILSFFSLCYECGCAKKIYIRGHRLLFFLFFILLFGLMNLFAVFLVYFPAFYGFLDRNYINPDFAKLDLIASNRYFSFVDRLYYLRLRLLFLNKHLF